MRGVVASVVRVVGVAAVSAGVVAGAVAGDEASSAALLREGRAKFDARAFDDARALFTRAAAAGEREQDPGAVVEGLALAARTFVAVDRLDDARPLLARAERLASPDAPLGWATFLAVRGRLRWKAKELPAAAADFEALYAFCVGRSLHERAVDAANMMLLVVPPEQQAAWGRKGIEAAERGGLESWLGPLWNNLGLGHEQAGRYADALECYVKARAYHWKLGKEVPKLAADWAVGHASRLVGRLDEAGAWLRPTLAWAERLEAASPGPEASEWVGHAAKELGLVALAQGRDAEALGLLERAEPRLAAAKMADWDAKGWDELVTALARLKAAPKAATPAPK